MPVDATPTPTGPVIGVEETRSAAPAGDVIGIAETRGAACSARHGGNMRQRQNAPRNAMALHGGLEAAPAMPSMERNLPTGWAHDDAFYAEPGASVVTGFAEPARDPGPEAPAAAGTGAAGREPAAAVEALVGMPLAEIERLVIEATIRACGDSLPQAARVLVVSPSTLYRKRAGWADRSGGA